MLTNLFRQSVPVLALTCIIHSLAQTAVASEREESSGLLGQSLDSRVASLNSTADPIATNRPVIRVLVSYNDTNYFVVNGKQRGLEYELMRSFGEFLNGRKNPGDQRHHLVFISVPFDRLLPRLTAGEGDIAAAGITVTPERRKQVAFTQPYRKNVAEVLVRNRHATPLGSVRDLAGKKVHVVSGSSYETHLDELNAHLVGAGLEPVAIVEVDSNLEAEDVLQMVNAGIYQYTVVDDHIARLWSQVLKNIESQQDVALSRGGEIAWAVRKGNQELLARLNEFVARHKQGTLMGNLLFKRYYENTRWVRNPMDSASGKRIARLRGVFEKFGQRYHIDWKLLAAVGYQESGLDQNKKSSSGAVGVMQISPTTAADKNIGVKGVTHSTAKNIQAGAKYLDFLRRKYFSDPAIPREAQLDFTLAAYNAGPARIRSLRKKAADAGLDPNRWFFNVEHVARSEIGNETVTYVANILKYYIAFDSVDATLQKRGQAGADIKNLADKK